MGHADAPSRVSLVFAFRHDRTLYPLFVPGQFKPDACGLSSLSKASLETETASAPENQKRMKHVRVFREQTFNHKLPLQEIVTNWRFPFPFAPGKCIVNARGRRLLHGRACRRGHAQRLRLLSSAHKSARSNRPNSVSAPPETGPDLAETGDKNRRRSRKFIHVKLTFSLILEGKYRLLKFIFSVYRSRISSSFRIHTFSSLSLLCVCSD